MSAPPVPPRTWVRFCAETGATTAPTTKIDRFRVDAVHTLRGAPIAGIAPGASFLRLESTRELPAGSGDIVGVTEQLLYTRAAERADLATTSPPGADALCVLIPVTKSEAWWQLAFDERDALFRGGARPGHLALGLPLARTLLRKLYHGRPLPGAGWDLLAYLECAPSERPQFEALLAALRDPERNPEWSYVERESEIWLTRSVAPAAPRG
jgi:hypothetical protein